MVACKFFGRLCKSSLQLQCWNPSFLLPSRQSALSLDSLHSSNIWLQLNTRGLRVRVKQSCAEQKIYNLENSTFANKWPPIDQIGHPITPFRCRETLRHLEILEMQKLQQMRKFQMPKVYLGDLVEVRYELSRTKQTFAVFQGFCVDLRLKGLNSSFVLKNTYDGVGVEQLFPFYSVRLLNVRVIRSVKNPHIEDTLKAQRQKPSTRDYRYKWHYNIRHKFERALGKHKPGIRSMEPKIRRRLQKISRKYLRQRIESGLPPYIWGGPYNILSRRRSRLIRAERYRRMLLYAWDEQRTRAEKLRRRREKQRWGHFEMDYSSKKNSALSALPSDHPLNDNLPK